ncbi:MAG: hypothetical protein QXQ48_09365 [Nitrososphaerota archaeon]
MGVAPASRTTLTFSHWVEGKLLLRLGEMIDNMRLDVEKVDESKR